MWVSMLMGIMLRANAQNNPVANPKAIIISGFARFTVLTPQTIRMEYDSTCKFNNAATFIVINRRLPVPAFTHTLSNGWLIINTAALEMRYKLNSGRFTKDNLYITYTKDKSYPISWKPGAVQKENLKGTYRTLDRMDGDSDFYLKKHLDLEPGLLAKDGWTLLDDSYDLLFDSSPWPWVKTKTYNKAQDWYFMGYSHDYKSALLNFTQIAGKVPLPPRYAFGYWWSRYWAYSDNELRDLVDHFHEYRIPLDVLVIDMDWHNEFSKDRWTGWSFNQTYFPDYKQFLYWTKEQKLKVTLNLHTAYGIAPEEPSYKAIAKSTGTDTVGHRIIPYAGSDKKFMTALFNNALHTLQKDGVDFWWLDWQQWVADKGIPQLDNVWWLNYTFFTDMQHSTDKRPLIYHRWGGLGNHRYEIGFSGDTYISWKSLAYQPYFTNTASNVLYGYWSHDIGGHQSLPGQSGIDPELYTRWVQYGSLSPIFRTHSSKSPTLNKEIWNFHGDAFDALIQAIRLRYQLAPYIYTMARKTYDTGISLCRPLYYDYPRAEQSYSNSSEYMFGDDILVAPIGEPMKNGLSQVSVWLPPGNDWYEWHTGTLLKGGQIVLRSFPLTEYPIYLKAGSIIPMYPDTITTLQREPDKQIIAVFPGDQTGAAMLYEDNGDDQHYDKAYATTRIIAATANRTKTITILPRTGNYKGIKRQKNYELKLYGSEIPEKVLVNGKRFNFSYNGAELAVILYIPKINCGKQTKIIIYYDRKQQTDVNSGLAEKMKRVRSAVKGLKYRNAKLVVPFEIGQMEELNRELEYRPGDFHQLIKTFNDNYRNLPELIKTLKLDSADERWFLRNVF